MNIKNISKAILLATTASILLNGCNSTSNVEIPKYEFPKNNVTMKFEGNIILDNGMLILQNGERIIDSAGNIQDYFTINDNLYYIVNSNNQEFIIKNKQNKVIEKFVANEIKVFKDGNEIFIATKTNIRAYVYENIFSFDGNKLAIINKNLDLSNGQINDRYFIKRNYYIQYNLRTFNIVITDIKNNSNVNLIAKYNPGARVYPIGIVNDNIYYVYGTSGFMSKTVFEVFNTKTNVSSTLFIGNDDKFQLYKNNDNIVLKIFNNKDVQKEEKLGQYVNNPISKYEQTPAKFVLLNTLQEIDGISNYKLIPIFTTYKNVGKEDVPLTIITFELRDLYQLAYDSETLLF